MTMIWTFVGIVLVLVLVLTGCVVWRDRHRVRSAGGDDGRASRAAQAEAESHRADRQAAQGVTWDRGRLDGQP